MFELSDDFVRYREALAVELCAEDCAQVDALIAHLPNWQRPKQFYDLDHRFIAYAQELQEVYEDKTLATINALLVATLALRLPKLELPASVAVLYPAACERLHTYLTQADISDYFYPNEFFLKDLCFAAGFTVPCGAMATDRRSMVGWKTSLLAMAKNPPASSLKFLPYCHTSPWLRSHLDTRYLDEFNERGMDAYYRQVAALLKADPAAKGLISSSWFYDEAAGKISPHLQFLTKPAQHGAMFLRGATTNYDIVSATAKSSKRRKLYEDGQYMPTKYLMVWPREALIDWAQHG